MSPIKIGPAFCGPGHPVFIAFEIGATIRGLASALAMTEVAELSGAQAIKVQILSPARLVGDPALSVSWRDAEGETVTEAMKSVLDRRRLSREEWAELGSAVHAAGLAFIATVDFPETLETACMAGADALKVCSGDVTHVDWIEEMAHVGLPIMLDTGNATIGEVERAVETCVRAGNSQIVIHNNPSGYPARLDSINLRVLTTLRQMFPEFVVAFSDHSIGRDMDIAAVALGASMIEKTLTLGREQHGPEHMFSLEPGEAIGFVQAIREVELALGTPRRILTDEERHARHGARRSAYVARDVPYGKALEAGDIDWRRPGGGIEPGDVSWLVGQVVSRPLQAGERFTRDLFQTGRQPT